MHAINHFQTKLRTTRPGIVSYMLLRLGRTYYIVRATHITSSGPYILHHPGNTYYIVWAVHITSSGPHLTDHSDRGAQYCSKEYVSVLQKSGIRVSMTENGDPYENAIAERTNGI